MTSSLNNAKTERQDFPGEKKKKKACGVESKVNKKHATAYVQKLADLLHLL